MSHGHQGPTSAGYDVEVEAERSAKDAYFRTSPQSPLDADARASFHGLAYFPLDASYRIARRPLLPYIGDGPIAFGMPTSDGRTRNAIRAGSFAFEVAGARHVLTAYRFPGAAHGELFVPFLDATSGHETYGAGRYLDLEASRDGDYVLDFNLAYHPYCAYSPNFSCPLAPDENRLTARIEAGERLGSTAD